MNKCFVTVKKLNCGSYAEASISRFSETNTKTKVLMSF